VSEMCEVEEVKMGWVWWYCFEACWV